MKTQTFYLNCALFYCKVQLERKGPVSILVENIVKGPQVKYNTNQCICPKNEFKSNFRRIGICFRFNFCQAHRRIEKAPTFRKKVNSD